MNMQGAMMMEGAVKNTQYLKDDTLYVGVSVEVSDHKPWLEHVLYCIGLFSS